MMTENTVNRVMLFGVLLASNELLFEKKLFKSDINGNCRLAIPKKVVENRIFKFCTHDQMRQVNGDGILFPIWDEGIKETFVFKQWPSSRTYVILSGWINFVRRQELKIGDIVQFWRDNVSGKVFIACTKNTNSVRAEEQVMMNTVSPQATLFSEDALANLSIGQDSDGELGKQAHELSWL